MKTARTRRLAPEPQGDAVYPWRWKLGQQVYALGRSEPLKVIGGELWVGCPHLHLLDGEGKVWRVPQLHTSSKAISPEVR